MVVPGCRTVAVRVQVKGTQPGGSGAGHVGEDGVTDMDHALRLLGRLNSAYRLLAWGTMPLGAAVGGLIGQLFGVQWVFVVMAALVVLQLIPMLWVTDRRMDEAEAAVEADEGAPVR